MNYTPFKILIILKIIRINLNFSLSLNNLIFKELNSSNAKKSLQKIIRATYFFKMS